jgi:GcrA cell cycle regulator
MSWTDDRVAVLTKMWGEGKTAAEIAKTLGGVTRNAVIGKAHRLKLSNRASPIPQPKKAANANASAANPAKVEKKRFTAKPQKDEHDHIAVVKAPETKKEIPAGGRVAMVDLSPRQCRWPSGDPREDDFSFCGEESVQGLPYCLDHCQVAYQTATRNRIMKSQNLETVSSEELEKAKEALKKVAS